MINGKIIKILVVEDEVYWFDLLKREVEKRGLPFRLRWTQHGGKALEVFKEGSEFDAVLMNLAMPLVDGIEATKALKALGIKTPIIAWTGYPKEAQEKACIEAGMADYVEKNAETLLPDVIEALHKCRAI